MPGADLNDAMPLPMGIYETGEFAAGIDPATIRQLGLEGNGAAPKELVEAKGTSKADHFGMVGGELNANSLEKAGWAVMFGPGVDKKIKTNLAPLMDLRKEQVGDARLFKILDPPSPGQSASDWLLGQKNSLNVVDPSKGVPYYVMIVASPEEISFEFQYELDLYWAVGRLWLEKLADFERYAQSVVAYETQASVPTARKMVVFAPNYDGKDNGAGHLLCDNLVRPMIDHGLGQSEKFALESLVGAGATKARLHQIFTGESGAPPALLFTGSHGLLKLPTSEELPDAQGAIVCQEWQGEPPPSEVYYAAWDLPKKANIHGMVHFLFACYGVGWPKTDTYNYQRKTRISPAPMMARLPQALLGRENGALAVLGHIDRAWSSSYLVNDEPQEQGFVDVITKIMSGYRLGSATDQMNFRWAALSIPLTDALRRMATKRGLEKEVARLLVRRDDARNFILHGDPAIQLRVGKKEMPPLA